MSTPAAAALFQAALPKPPQSTSTSKGEGGFGSIRGRGGRLRGGRGGRGGGSTSEDVGMSEASEGGVKRRGRQTARHPGGPMGDRPLMKVDGKPYDPKSRGPGRNTPAMLRDEQPRSRSSPASTSTGPPTQGAVETLRLFLISRYSPEAKMLNLENMASDTILKEAGLQAPGEKNAPQNLSGALWKLAAKLFPEVVSISLANNSLTSLLPLSPFLLTSNLPNLQNVSLASNSLSRLRDMDPLSPTIGNPRGDKKPKGWKDLRELVLTGNPLVGTGADEADYRIQIARRFPTLRQLDQQPLDPSIAFVASAAASASASASALTPGLSSATKKDAARVAKTAKASVIFPLPVASGFAESEGTRGFVAGFIMKFFPAFDTDRPSLAAAYSPICTFSFQVDTQVPFRTRAKKIGGHGDKKFPNQHKLTWTEYLGGGRNLTRVAGPGKRVANLHLTPNSVVAKLLAMPKTIHPLNEAEKFVFEAWTMPGVLAPTVPGAAGEMVIFVSLHGEFMELPSKGTRSFDRTFILAPAQEGSPAQLAGWPCVILSDSFTVRGYSDPSAWAPPPAPAAVPAATIPIAGPSITPVVPIQQRAEGLTDLQQQIVLELQAVTRLTYTFAHMCLVQNGWEPAVALANFQALHAAGSIPPEAFIQG